MDVPHPQICPSCQSIASKLFSETLLSGYEWFDLASDFSDLELSAKDGCHMCSIFFVGITSNLPVALKDLRSHKNKISLLIKTGHSYWYTIAAQDKHNPHALLYTICDLHISSSSVESLFDRNILQEPEALHLSLLDEEPFSHYTHENFTGLCDLTSQHGLERLATTVLGWLDICRASHTCCASSQGGQRDYAPLPTRVLDVGTLQEPTLHVHVAGVDERHEYAALSYCWGHGVPELKVTTTNIKSMMSSVPFDGLPKTIQDAVKFARQLGIKYLWVDALCILQDDSSDWQREAAQFSVYYEKAVCTISATGSWDSNEGLFLPSNDLVYPTYFTIKETGTDPIERPQYFTFVPRNLVQQELITESPLLMRGWAVQERILSTRIVHFTRRFAIWECKQLQATERWPEQSIDLTQTYRDDYIGMIRNRLVENDMAGLQKEWLNFCKHFTTRRFTHVSDRLPALSGLARIVQAHTGLKYYAGLWEGSITELLPWYINTVRSSVRTKEFSTAPSLGPSWSWVNSRGDFGFLTPYEEPWNYTMDKDLVVHDINVQHIGRDTDGLITGGMLTIGGEVGALNLADLGYRQYPRLSGSNKWKTNFDAWREGIFWDYVPKESEVLTEYVCLRLGISTTPGKDSQIISLILTPTATDGFRFRRVGLGFINSKTWEQCDRSMRILNII